MGKTIKIPPSFRAEIARHEAERPKVILPEDRLEFLRDIEPEFQVSAEAHWNTFVDANEAQHRFLRQREGDGVVQVDQPDSFGLVLATGDGAGREGKILLEILAKVTSLSEKVDIRPNPRADGWMSTEHAAEYLGMKPRGVRVAAETGRLLGHKNAMSKSRGNRWRFKKAELDKYMPSQKRKTSRDDISIWK